LGTFGNCANGKTPWGTYLTLRREFRYLFGTHQADYKTTADQKRYTLKVSEPERNWPDYDERFDVAKNPNEFNRHGWIVEIDPMNPGSSPIKHTALGRFKHENAAVTVARMVAWWSTWVTMSVVSTSINYVSKGVVDVANPANNRSLLDEGTLYVGAV
jgi:uncharacterized protein